MEINNISNKIQQEFIEPKSDDLLKENSNIIKEEYIEKLKNDNIIFNGKTFLINKKGTEYKNKKNIKRIIYKCANNRHDEKTICCFLETDLTRSRAGTFSNGFLVLF